MKKLFSVRNLEMLVGMVGLVCLALGLLLYFWNEPVRLASAQAAQIETDLDAAMSVYAENCAVCHGLAGEGIGAIPALDNPSLAQSDPAALEKIIARGLYGTSMPAWSQEDGGPLSDYQIEQMVTLILHGNWSQVQERVVNLGLAPKIPFNVQADPVILEQIKALPDGDKLANGVVVFANECVACHGADGLGTTLAPALNDPAVREKGAAEIERALLNGVPGTLMAAWNNALARDELDAVMALITGWEAVPVGAIPAPDVPVPVTAESLALGSNLYATNCSRCHGPEGQGTQRAPSLNVKSYLAGTSDAAIQQILTLGVPGTAMPAWGDRMTEEEIQAIVGFIRSWEPTAPEVAVPVRRGGGPWWATGGTRPNGAALPSGGQSTGPAAGPTPPAATSAKLHPGAAWPVDLDWRAIALLAITGFVALGLIGLGISGLHRRTGAA